MRKIRRPCIVAVAFAILMISALPLFCGVAMAAEEVTTQELVENMEKYDGQEVTITGEAIGDLMARDDYAWITVNDDAYSIKSIEEGGDFAGLSNYGIGVWAPRGKLEQIHVLGGYKNKGDWVQVTGTFNRVCHEHGGDTDIHAKSVVVLEEGYPMSHPFQYTKLLVAIILAIIIVALWMVRRNKIHKALRKA